MVYMKGTGTWDAAFETITKAFKKLRGFATRKPQSRRHADNGLLPRRMTPASRSRPLLPLAEPPKNPPQRRNRRRQIAAGPCAQVRASRLLRRLDNTYEAITNFLDEKRLEAKDMFIEQYVTDPLTTNEENLVVNVFVMIK